MANSDFSIKPCMFCESKRMDIIQVIDHYQVFCTNCEYSSAKAWTKPDVVANHNLIVSIFNFSKMKSKTLENIRKSMKERELEINAS